MSQYDSGIDPSTLVWKFNGDKVAAGDVRVGDVLMQPGVKPARVARVIRGTAECYRRTLKSMHKKKNVYTGITMPTIVCTYDTVFEFGTSQVVKNYVRQRVNFKPTPKRMVVITVMRDHERTDGSVVSVPYNVGKQFDLDESNEVVDAYIEENTVPGIKWHVWKGTHADHAMMKGDAAISTRRMRRKTALIKPFLRNWLKQRFAGEGIGAITDKNLVAMAWMIGFWLGDGYRSGPYFALHSEDHDVNNYLKRAAKQWRMEYIFIKLHGGPFQACCRLDYYPLGETKKSARKDNILITVLTELGFYSNHTMNGPKGGPLFMATDEPLVKVHCLCGLIDSDGTTAKYDNVERIKIVTVYPPIRDLIIALGQSLMVSVTSTFQAAHITCQGAQKKDTWIIHMFHGQNHKAFQLILANLACDRKRVPPVRMSRRYRKQIGLIVTDTEDEGAVDSDEEAWQAVEENAATGRVARKRASKGATKSATRSAPVTVPVVSGEYATEDDSYAPSSSSSSSSFSSDDCVELSPAPPRSKRCWVSDSENDM